MPRAFVEGMRPSARISHSDDGEKGGGQRDHVREAVFPAQSLGFADFQGLVHDLADDIGAASPLAQNLEAVHLGIMRLVQVPACGKHIGLHFRRKCRKFWCVGGVGHCHFASLAAYCSCIPQGWHSVVNRAGNEKKEEACRQVQL